MKFQIGRGPRNALSARGISKSVADWNSPAKRRRRVFVLAKAIELLRSNNCKQEGCAIIWNLLSLVASFAGRMKSLPHIVLHVPSSGGIFGQ